MTTRSNESNNILDSTTKVTEVKRNFAGRSFLRHDNGIIRNTTGLKISHSRLSELRRQLKIYVRHICELDP